MPKRSYSRSRSRSFDRKDGSHGRGGGHRGDGGRYEEKDDSRNAGGREEGGRGSFRSRSPPAGGGYRGGPGPDSPNKDAQIYVARFGRRTTENELKKAFDKYGPIEKIDIKEGRGFGFIYFENRRDADDAIENMNGRTLPYEDDRLVVEKAGGGRRGGRRPMRRSRSRGYGDGGGFGGPRGGSDSCYNCGKGGHFARDCRASPRGDQRNERRRDGPPRDAVNDGRCFICDEKGHKKFDCPQRRGGRGGGGYRGGGFRRRSRSRSGSSSFHKRGNRSRSRSNSRGKRQYRDRKQYSRSPERYRRQGGQGKKSYSNSKSKSPRDNYKKFRNPGGRRGDQKNSISRSGSRGRKDSKNSQTSQSRNSQGGDNKRRNSPEQFRKNRRNSRSKSGGEGFRDHSRSNSMKNRNSQGRKNEIDQDSRKDKHQDVQQQSNSGLGNGDETDTTAITQQQQTNGGPSYQKHHQQDDNGSINQDHNQASAD